MTPLRPISEPAAGGLTTVMYHYVRPIRRSPWPRIKGLELEAFREQLAWLRRHHTLVSTEDVRAALRGEASLPDDAALLTFDDGYRDHYEHVFPLLHDAGVSGAFFTPVATVGRRELADVNRIHFVLAACPDPGILRRELDALLEARRADGETLPDPGERWAQWGAPNRYDPPEVNYVKRLLQVGLPEDVRHAVAKELFARHVTADEAAFVEELYVTPIELREMLAAGMHVGAHGDTHRWLDSLCVREQAAEVDASVDFLRSLGVETADGWTICYPYGGWNESLLALLRERGCSAGFTVRPAVTDVATDDPLLLPRFDTNDFPPQAPHAPTSTSRQRSIRA